MRLGKYERALLETLIASERMPYRCDHRGACLYIDHVPGADRFNYDRELRVWLEGVELKGLIHIKNRFFIYITPRGREAIAPNSNATP